MLYSILRTVFLIIAGFIFLLLVPFIGYFLLIDNLQLFFWILLAIYLTSVIILFKKLPFWPDPEIKLQKKVIINKNPPNQFGPTKIDRIGTTIGFALMVGVLNLIIFFDSNPVLDWTLVWINLSFAVLIYLNDWLEYIYIIDDSFIYKNYRKRVVDLTEIVTVRKIWIPAYKGIPHPGLSLEIPRQKNIEIGITNWREEILIELLRRCTSSETCKTFQTAEKSCNNTIKPKEFSKCQKFCTIFQWNKKIKSRKLKAAAD